MGTVRDAAGKAVNRKVHGSNPCSGAIFEFRLDNGLVIVLIPSLSTDNTFPLLTPLLLSLTFETHAFRQSGGADETKLCPVRLDRPARLQASSGGATDDTLRT